jgi:glycogen debranching enzyme
MIRRILYIALLPLLPLLQMNAQLPSATVPAGSDALFTFSNGYGAFYCGPVSGDNGNGFHGVTQNKRKLFEQYWILLGDMVLDRRTAECTVSPAGIQRRYPQFNTIEEIFFCDSLTMLVVGISTEWKGEVKIFPSLAPDFGISAGGISGGTFVIESHQRLTMHVDGLTGSWGRARPRDAERLSSPPPANIPAMYWGECDGEFGISFEWQPLEATAQVRTPEELHGLLQRKSSRIEALLAEAAISTGDEQLDETFAWILASTDALLVREPQAGIWAGLPWFDDFWGRDTFISLPGALLSTGRFADALRVIEAFAARIDTVRGSPTYGRIPNRVQPGEVIYNTVDGTPWMLYALWRYYEHSGDADALKRLFPFVAAAVEGALTRCDEHGLLRHADAETWMDAVGGGGPWSPRGDRAIEIQILWLAQLRASARIARIAGRDDLADAWESVQAVRVHRALTEHFIDPDNNVLYDHLNSDGSPDRQTRPNSLFAFTLGREAGIAFSEEAEDSTLLRIFSECVYPWGVASLSMRDDHFHPYHEAPKQYPKDAAYHNGTIWTWLSGPAIEILCGHGLADSAWVLTEALHRMTMHSGAVGTIPECTDALPRNGATEPRWSGTFSQAWSNAEYLRTMRECYLGARVRFDGQAVIEFHPALPQALERLSASVRTAAGAVRITVERMPNGRLRAFFESGASEPVLIRPSSQGHSGEARFAQQLLPAGGSITLELPPIQPDAAFAEAFRFARSGDASAYAVMQAPDYPLLNEAEVTRRNADARALCSAQDALQDDTGPTGGYVYPANAHFRPGILDLAGMDVTADERYAYFTVRMRALSQPGWHPEYGFQLTMLAIAVDRRRDSTSSTAREIGHNSGYVLDEGSGFTHLILVGGGIEVRGADGGVLAAYVPESSAGAFGNVASGEIRFALPLALFGATDAPWRFTVVAGAQDDHGGAGIGEFRTVLPERTEWNGGGSAEAGVNWYDELRCP